jgi:hypothetical protein
MALLTARDPQHRPPLTDFTVFYAAASMAAAGHAAEIYDAAQTDRAVSAIAAIPPGKTLPYFYPPSFLLATQCLAPLPYWAAFSGFFILTGGACFAAFTRLARRLKLPPSATLAAPATLIAFLSAQNGFLSAAIFTTAALWLDTRPWLAGALLGLFAVKPQLALSVPVALLAARRLKSVAAAFMSAASLMILPVFCYGLLIWQNFWAARGFMRLRLEADRLDWIRQLSPFTALRLWRAPLDLAYAAQALIALAVLIAIALACRRRPGALPEIALMTSGAVLLTPHVIDYDIVLITPALLFLLREGIAQGFRPYEKTVLLAVYLLPFYARILNQACLPVAALALLALFWLVWRRVSATPPMRPA